MILFIGEVVFKVIFEVVGEVFASIFFKALGYNKKTFYHKGSLPPGKALMRIQESIDTQSRPWSRSSDKFLIGTVDIDNIKVGCGKWWGPVFRGTVTKSADGSTLKGNFALGPGAIATFGIICASLFATAILVLGGMWPGTTIFAWLSLSSILLVVGLLRIAKFKQTHIQKIERQLRECLAPAGAEQA